MAPAELVADASKLDSALAIALSRLTSTLYFSAASSKYFCSFDEHESVPDDELLVVVEDVLLEDEVSEVDELVDAASEEDELVVVSSVESVVSVLVEAVVDVVPSGLKPRIFSAVSTLTEPEAVAPIRASTASAFCARVALSR
jgi:hypothetical protein